MQNRPAQTLQLPDHGQADQLAWTQDGNVLSVSTKQGSLHSYLMKVPCLCAGWDTKVAFLASLRELCVTDRSVHPSEDIFARPISRLEFCILDRGFCKLHSAAESSFPDSGLLTESRVSALDTVRATFP